MFFLIDPYDFALEIPERILDRGYGYWSGGAIVHLSVDKSGEWTATVAGRENYLVRITPTEDEMVICRCSCPFAADALCKHIAAVLLELEELEVDFSGVGQLPEEYKSISGSFEDLLEQAGRDRLAEFIRVVCGADPRLHQKFMAYMTPGDANAGKPEYRRLIKNALLLLERQGYSYGPETREAMEPVNDLLDQAEKLAEQDAWNGVIDISLAVLEEVVPAMDYLDDSGGDADAAITTALQLLWESAEQPLEPKLRANFFSWCMHAIRGDTYEGWDVQSDLIAIAVRLAESREQVSDIESFLDDRIETFSQYVDNFGLRYNLEQAASLKITLLRNNGRLEEAKTLMEEYHYLPRVLEMLIYSLFEAEEYDRVEELAQNAIEEYGEQLQGLADGWMEWLVKVAAVKGDDELMEQRLGELFYMAPDMENFRRFKSAVPERRWPQTCDEVIGELKKRERVFGILPEIYEEENRMKELMAWLKKNPGFGAVDRFGHHFFTSHGELIFSLYEELIRDLLTKNTGREYYRKVARILSKLAESGFSSQVSTLVGDLKKVYYRRPALQEEFKRL